MEKVESQLLFEPMKIFCERNPVVHTWNDTSKLMGLNPRMMKKPKEADVIQATDTMIQLLVSQKLKDALTAKFPENLSASLRSVLQACAEPVMMILSATDMQRITERVGKMPKTSGELFGMIFGYGEEIKELKNEIVQLRKKVAITMRGNAAGVIVDLGEEALPKAVAKADAAGVSLEEMLSAHCRDAVLNDWIV